MRARRAWLSLTVILASGQLAATPNPARRLAGTPPAGTPPAATRPAAIRSAAIPSAAPPSTEHMAESQSAPAQAADGAAVYASRCASCHDRADGRTPAQDALRSLTAHRILRTLDFGTMMTIAYPLRRDEREAVARHLGRPDAEPGPRPEAFCTNRSLSLAALGAAPTWNGWSPAPDNTRHAAAALARLTAADVPALH